MATNEPAVAEQIYVVTNHWAHSPPTVESYRLCSEREKSISVWALGKKRIIRGSSSVFWTQDHAELRRRLKTMIDEKRAFLERQLKRLDTVQINTVEPDLPQPRGPIKF